MGFTSIGKEADTAIENLSFRNYCGFTSDIDGAVGTIKDSQGVVLWSEDKPGTTDTYNLIGDLKAVAAQNTVSYRNKQYITSAEGYDLYEGVISLENSGLDINTTLDYELHKSVYEYMVEKGVTNGSALFMDAKTGAIVCAVSLPAADPTVEISQLPEGALINKNFATTIPGSNMKVITGLLLTEIEPSILKHEVYCDGSYELPRGSSITCITRRGTHNLESALGVSCNCYYADSIVNILDQNADTIKGRLEELGISTQSAGKVMKGGKLTYTSSMAAYAGDGSFESVWAMIGEGKVMMSPLDMCRIVSGIVNDGTGKMPYIIENVTNSEGEIIDSYSAEDSHITDAETAETFYAIWKSAYDKYYGTEYHSEITFAKSGTAEYANKGVSKNLVGYLEEQGLVFFIEIADYEESQLMPYEVVNYVCDMT